MCLVGFECFSLILPFHTLSFVERLPIHFFNSITRFTTTCDAGEGEAVMGPHICLSKTLCVQLLVVRYVQQPISCDRLSAIHHVHVITDLG